MKLENGLEIKPDIECVFLFLQNEYEGIALLRGIGLLKLPILIFVKVISFRKRQIRRDFYEKLIETLITKRNDMLLISNEQ